jgi:hypothetical protein
MWDQNEVWVILDVWWFNIPAPVEWRGPPRLKTPIQHSNPRILRTHNEIWDQNEVGLILDVWWFNIPAPVEYRGPPHLKTPIAQPQLHIQTPEFLEPTMKSGTKTNLG